MKKFEYKVLDVVTTGWWWGGGRVNHQELAEKLNEFGKEGWEVVSSTSVNRYYGSSRSVMIILKKPVNNNE